MQENNKFLKNDFKIKMQTKSDITKISIFKKFPRTFWVANTVELFERWAWYGLFMVLALYLTGSQDEGALGFSQAQKGLMMGAVTGSLYVLPVITGAIADKFGYKRILLIAFVLYAVGYFLMGQFTSYTSVFIAFGMVGIGAALFKPVISATIAKTTNDKTSSIGFGIFYMMVNIGAFVGPIFASKLRQLDWNYVFYMSSFVLILNFLLVFLMYKEPQIEENTEPLGKTVKTILKNILIVLKDWKFVLFLLLIVGFWTMYNQLFYSLPVFIEQWMDTSTIYDILHKISPSLAQKIGTENGTISPEMLTNIDALYIVIFQILVSSFVMKFKPLNAMIGGIFVASVGIGLMFMFHNPFYLFVTILIFGLGEMSSSPKITEYIGKIAPKEKKALYMGMSFLPLAGGNFFAGYLSGDVYGKISDKIFLLKKFYISKGWEIPEINENFSQNDFISQACNLLQMTEKELTIHLWNAYNPSNIWYIFTGIGLITVVGLFFYDKFLLKSK